MPLVMNDLPDELLEFILSLVPPYEDLRECALVCRRWRNIVQNVVVVKRRQLHTALTNGALSWHQVPADGVAAIAGRFAHAAVVCGDAMYVFGGCTNSMTAFNDLWRLDLATRTWIRPVASGIYPIPKACTSMVYYQDKLIIFGGLAYPSSYPFHQSYQLFSELHVYEVGTQRWECAATASNDPPAMAGHSASVHVDCMVVFGGMQRCSATGNTLHTNDVWRLDLRTMRWRKQPTSAPRPKQRYGHSQTALDERHALIMGGSGGPNGLYNDVWLLIMRDNDVWQWKQVSVCGMDWAPLNMWCHPTCRVGSRIVVLNPPRQSRQRPRRAMHSATGGCLPRPRTPAVHSGADDNVNGRRGTLPTPARLQPQPNPPEMLPSTSRLQNNLIKIRDSPRSGHLSLAAFATQPATPAARDLKAGARNRERQLELLRRMERALMERRAQLTAQSEATRRSGSALALHLLDTSRVLGCGEPSVTWLEPTRGGPAWPGHGPDDTVLYTLVQAHGELVMFGGIQKHNPAPVDYALAHFDPSPYSYSAKVSNRLHFLSPPLHII